MIITGSRYVCFYNNWVICRAQISQELWLRVQSTDHGNNVMKTQFVFLFLSRAIFRETSTELDVKLICQSYCKKKTKKKKQIDNNFPRSLLLIDHRNVVRMFKTETFWRHFHMIDHSIQTMENCCRFVKFGEEEGWKWFETKQITFPWTVPLDLPICTFQHQYCVEQSEGKNFNRTTLNNALCPFSH